MKKYIFTSFILLCFLFLPALAQPDMHIVDWWTVRGPLEVHKSITVINTKLAQYPFILENKDGNYFARIDTLGYETLHGGVMVVNTKLKQYPLLLENKDGNYFLRSDSAGNLTITGTLTYNALINAAGISTITGLSVGYLQSSQLANITVTNYAGTTKLTFDSTGKVQWGTGTSTGILGGGGVNTSSTLSLGAGSSGDKAFSFYLSSTSTTTSHVETGFYMNMNYGTTAGQGAPSGDVIRGRAYLIGSAAGTNALTGGAFSVEFAATTATNSALTAGMRGNLVFPNGVMTGTGTFYGTEGELYLGGASTDLTSYTEIAPLGICISGTNPTNANQLGNVGVMAIRIPSNEIGTGLLLDNGTAATIAGKLRIKVNGATYYILLTQATGS